MNNIIIKLDRVVATISILKEKENTTYTTYVNDLKIGELVTYFAINNILSSFSIEYNDGQNNITFKDSNNNALTFVIQDENQEYGLNYINYLIDKYYEDRKIFYEKEKEVRIINIAVSTNGFYYEKLNDETVNYVLYVNNDDLTREDLDFVRQILEELIFDKHQNMVEKEKNSIVLFGTENQIITLPKILFLKVNNIIKKRKRLKKLAFKKEGRKK